MSRGPGLWKSWRRLWIDLHTWVGMLISGVLLIYGASTIVFNHPGWFPHSDRVSMWQKQVTPMPRDARHAGFHAQALRGELGLVGEVPFRQARYADGDVLQFEVHAGGRVNEVVVTPGGEAQVVVHYNGIAASLLSLHGNNGMEGSSVLAAWGWKLYTNFSIVGMLFAVPSGLFLWWPRRGATTPFGMSLLVAGTLLFVATAVLIY